MTAESLPEKKRAVGGVSRRGDSLPTSPIRDLAPFAADAKRRGIRIFHLNIGQPDLETPSCMRDRLDAFDAKVIDYSPSEGTPEFLDAMQGYYRTAGIELQRGQILATTGGSEALLFAMMACADPGDEIIVLEPSYANYRSFATMAGVELVPLTSRAEDNFHLPPRSRFEQLLTDRTRMVLICNPNNPTGTVYTKAELETVADFCREHDLVLLADEVYREFVYDGRRAVSALTLDGMDDRVIVVDSLSKRYSACGIRLGCFVTRSGEIYETALRMAQARLSPPGLAQELALGLTSLGSDYFDAITTEYGRRRDVLYEELGTIPGVFLRKPEGAFYQIARLPVDDVEDFARWLLSDFRDDGETVMIAPATGFYITPGLGMNEVRLAYVLREEELRRAAAILARALESYHERRRY